MASPRRSEMAAQGWRQGKGAKGVAGPPRSERHPPPASAPHFVCACGQPGRSPLNREWPKSHREAASPGAFTAQSPRGWSSALPPSPRGREPFSSPPAWAFLSTAAQCSQPCARGHVVGQGGRRHRGSFLEGTLSKKCAEKWFGRWFGLEESCFPLV